MRAHGPRYSLDEARAAIQRGRYSLTSRPRTWLENHGYEDTSVVLRGIFNAMDRRSYLKTNELRVRPGTYADIYDSVLWDNEEWYVKFFMTTEGEPVVEVWSLNWDGSIH